ncbi:MAG: formate dehydrogenase accessory sulfurtransferase FdhD [Anaerolineales bacterium]|nr:formate dehydrogenase accessory sulfurtransferase FdhD [Anaerolineales bacterium]
MTQASKSIHFKKVNISNQDPIQSEVIIEKAVSLTVNGKVWLTFMCTPLNLEALALGFLYNESIIDSIEEVADVHVCKREDNVDVWLNKSVEEPRQWRRTSGCTGGFTASNMQAQNPEFSNSAKIPAQTIINLMATLSDSQPLYKKSGGVHSSAISDGREILFSVEDIGRHNTLDKIAGTIIQKSITPDKRIILTTGRISSEMLQKTVRIGASIVVSRTAPTSLSIEYADAWGITLIGYARRAQFNLYTHPERIGETIPEKP